MWSFEVLSPPCGMATYIILQFRNLIRLVLSPPCGMATEVEGMETSLPLRSKPTVWDGDYSKLTSYN